MHTCEQANNERDMRPGLPRTESKSYCCMCTVNQTQNHAYSSHDYCANTMLSTCWIKFPMHRKTQLLRKHKVSNMWDQASCMRNIDVIVVCAI